MAHCTRRTSLTCAAVLAALLIAAGAHAQGEGYPEQIATLREAGRLPEAAQIACDWAAAEPGSVEALRACAETTAAVGLFSRAEDALRSLLFFVPDDSEALALLGDVLLERGRYADAREQFEALIQLDGSSAAGYTGLARASRYDAGSPGEMFAAAELAVAVAPDYAPAHAAMGAALREVGRLDEALASLERAREIAPDDHRAAFELGLVLSLLGETERAQEAWRAVVTLRPCSSEAWLLLSGLVVTRVEPILDRAFDAQYSPDGTRIAYRARGEGGWGIYTTPADGPVDETRLWATEEQPGTPAWSPDSSQIAVTVWAWQQAAGGGRQRARRLLLLPAEGGVPKLVLEDHATGTIAWNALTGRIGTVTQEPRKGFAIIEIDPRTGEITRLPGLSGSVPYLNPTWSPDGSTLAVGRRIGRPTDQDLAYELMVGPAEDFSSARSIRRSSLFPRPVFTADCSALVIATPDDGSNQLSIWAIPVDGSRDPVLIDPAASTHVLPSFSPDGRFMLTARDTMLARATLAGLQE